MSPNPAEFYFSTSLNKIFFGLAAVLLLAFLFLLPLNFSLYTLLAEEDHLIESLTAVLLFISGLILVRTIFVHCDQHPRAYSKLSGWALGVASALLIWAALEEISFGQRILGIETPEALKAINDQDELNLHNVDKLFFDRLLDRATIALVLLGTVLRIRNQRMLWGIPMPDTWLICLFALSPFMVQYNISGLDFFHIQIPILIILGVYHFRQANLLQIWAVAITLLLASAIYLVHTHYQFLFREAENAVNEYREFLFSLASVAYALHIGRVMGLLRIHRKKKYRFETLSHVVD
ncbi:MAG: hypothetical protein ACK417_02850 [Bacteroidia bacterium]